MEVRSLPRTRQGSPAAHRWASFFSWVRRHKQPHYSRTMPTPRPEVITPVDHSPNEIESLEELELHLGLAPVAATAAGPADLLSGAQPGLCRKDRQGLERAPLRSRLCHPLPGTPVLPRPLPGPPSRRPGNHRVLDPRQDLSELNDNIVGLIELAAEYH